MAITTQAKRLRRALKNAGCTNSTGGTVKVRTERHYAGKDPLGRSIYMFGDAVSHINPPTREQVEAIREALDGHVTVRTHFPDKPYGFAVVRH